MHTETRRRPPARHPTYRVLPLIEAALWALRPRTRSRPREPRASDIGLSAHIARDLGLPHDPPPVRPDRLPPHY